MSVLLAGSVLISCRSQAEIALHAYWLESHGAWKDKPLTSAAYEEIEGTADPRVRNGRIYMIGSVSTAADEVIHYDSSFTIERRNVDQISILAVRSKFYLGHPSEREDFADMPVEAVAIDRSPESLTLVPVTIFTNKEGGEAVTAHLIIPKRLRIEPIPERRSPDPGTRWTDPEAAQSLLAVPMRLDPDRRCPRP